MTGTDLTCHVMIGNQSVGIIQTDRETAMLTYDDDWKSVGFPLSPSLPLDGSAESGAVFAFVENMLPEGEALEQLVLLSQIPRRDVLRLAMALSVRNDLPGAVRLVDGGSRPSAMKDAFRPITEAEILERLKAPDICPLTVWDGAPRLSVAGVQTKLNVLKIGEDYGLAEGENLASDRLLKFEKPSVKHLVLNEYLTMKLAAGLGYSVADVHLLRFGDFRALEVLRFDRKVTKDKGQLRVKRRHVIDGCQALGKTSILKYECPFGRGVALGINFEMLFGLCRAAEDRVGAAVTLLDWRLFNLIVGNTDAHGKNMSFFVRRAGLTPAPWYDLVSVAMIPGVDHALAMGVDGEYDDEKVHALQLLYEADAIGVPKTWVAQRLAAMLASLEKTLPAVTAVAEKETLTDEERRFVWQYAAFIRQRLARWQAEAKLVPELLKDESLF